MFENQGLSGPCFENVLKGCLILFLKLLLRMVFENIKNVLKVLVQVEPAGLLCYAVFFFFFA